MYTVKAKAILLVQAESEEEMRTIVDAMFASTKNVLVIEDSFEFGRNGDEDFDVSLTEL